MVVVAVDSSLDGVVVARTALAYVDGQRGRAVVRGYSLADLAAMRSYEDVAQLVLRGELPANAHEQREVRARLVAHSALDEASLRACRALRDALPHASALASALALADDASARGASAKLARAERVLARVPSVCAAITGVSDLPTADSYARRSLAALGSSRTDEAAVRALEVLLSLESEHGLSASTFACRVAASSGADAGPSLSAAMATLSGPRHGGATSDALALLERAHASGNVRAFVGDCFTRGERLAGFGHRVYKVPDPRVPPMRDAMRAMTGVRFLETAVDLERFARETYGAKGVHANIDLFAAALLDGLGVDRRCFAAAFALGVACGWLAHWIEQGDTGRLVRPDSAYDGPPDRPVPPAPTA